MAQLLQSFWAEVFGGVATLVIVAYFSWLSSHSSWVLPASMSRLARGLTAYARSELALMASWPSVISTRVIDFSCDYVSLILIENRKSHLVSTKRTIAVEELLASRSPIAVVSGPGCGKTTLQLHLHHRLTTAWLSIRQKPTTRSISFFMRAHEIATQPRTTIREEIEARLTHHIDTTHATRFVEEGLAAGWFVVLIDGLDEIKSAIPRFLEELKRFAELYPECLLIVSSRPISYDLSALVQHGSNRFKEIAIAPLTRKVKRMLIEKYAPDALCAERTLALIRDPLLAELTNVTVNLLLLLNAVAHGKTIKCKSDFYTEAVRTLLHELPDRKSMTLAYDLAEKREVLAYLCYQALIWGKPLEMETLWSCAAAIATKRKVFSEILESSGLLRLVAANRYDFPHRTFAEYFAAVYVAQHLDELSSADWQHVLSVRSAEIIGFVCNMIGRGDAVVRRVLDNAQPSPYLLAICLAESAELDERLQETAETIIWAYVRESNELVVPNSAARAILSRIHFFPKPRSFCSLYDRLIDSLTRPESARLGQFASQEETQTYAMKFLVHTRSSEIVPHLVEIFRDPASDTYVRFKAGELLTDLADEHLLPDLERSYAENGDADVRRFVVEALVATRSDDAIRILEVATKDGDLVIQDLARDGIRYIRNQLYLEESALVRVADDEGQEKIIVPGSDITQAEALKVALDPYSPYRIDAFNFLRKHLIDEGTEKLAKLALDPEESEFFRCEAVRLIGSQPSADFAQHLVDVFTSPRQSDSRNGAGARGCAIEYLAHRGRRDLVLSCITQTDICWRTSNERCKIIWSVYESVRQARDCELEPYLDGICQLCAVLGEDHDERVLYWRAKVAARLAGKPVEIHGA